LGEAPRFPTADLVPRELRAGDDVSRWVVLPLQVGTERVGHMMLDADNTEGLIWESLCEQVSLAIELCSLRR
jgi:hypothetical protein